MSRKGAEPDALDIRGETYLGDCNGGVSHRFDTARRVFSAVETSSYERSGTTGWLYIAF
jgi:hypothetical protein